MKVTLKITTSKGELVIEGESLGAIAEELRSLGIELKDLFMIGVREEGKAISGEEKTLDLESVFEFTDKGPTPIIDLSNLSVKDSILLLLYGDHVTKKKGLRSNNIADILRDRGLATSTSSIYARISELKKDGYVIKDKERYKLSRRGIDFVKNKILPKINVS